MHQGGLGDYVLLSGLLREMAKRKKTALVICHDRSLLPKSSEKGLFVLSPKFPIVGAMKIWKAPIFRLSYVDTLPPDGVDEIPPKQHILAEMCARAGIRGEIERKGHFDLSPREKAESRKHAGAVVVQSTCLTARYPMLTKEWGVSKMQAVVDSLKGHRRIIQLGTPQDPLLSGAEDFRGLSPRASASVLAGADLFVGLVGFLMHLARAVDTPAVIVYGGREKPWQSGYGCFENLVSDVPCSPCWRYRACAGNQKCLEIIRPEEVIEKVWSALAKPRAVLTAEKLFIQASPS